MEKNGRRESTEQTTPSPLERTSLAEVYQAYTRLVGTMIKAHFSVTSLEMAKQKASYVVGVADTPKCKLYHLHFFFDLGDLTQFIENISKKGKIYHCTDEHGHTIAA